MNKSVEDCLVEALTFLQAHRGLSCSSCEVRPDGKTRLVFKEESASAFRSVFSCREATLTRGSYGYSYVTVEDGDMIYECQLPKLPETEKIML